MVKNSGFKNSSVESEFIKETENKYQSLVENSPDAIVIYVEGKIVFVNKESLRLMATESPEELIGKTGLQFIHPDYREKVVERMKKVATEGVVLPFMEEKFIRPDGSEVVVEVKAIPIRFENKPAVQLIIRDITERKHEEEALRKSEEKYHTLFENVQDVFFQTDLSGIILEISPSIKYFAEFNRDEMLGSSICNFYNNPSDRVLLLDAITKNGEIRDYELMLKTKTGQLKNVSVNARLISSPEGSQAHIDGAIRDISERKQAEKALRESEEKYRFLFANNPQPMWVYDLETLGFLEVNQAAVDHYGYSNEEFLSMTIKDIRPTEDIPQLVNHLGLSRHIINKAGTWRHLKKNGEIIFVEITSHAVSFNGRNARHILVNDITESKRTEKALIKSEQKYRNLHKSMVDGFAYVNMQGLIIDFNESFKQLLGYRDEELSLLNYNDLTPEKWHDFEHQIIAEQVLVRGYSDIYVKEYQKKDGTIFPVEIHTFLLRNDAGENEGMWAIVRDITERKRAEEALIESRQQLLDIIDFLPDATFVIDNEKKVIAWNKAIEEMTGVKKQDMIGKGDYAYAIPFYGKKQNLFVDILDAQNEKLKKQYRKVGKEGLAWHAEVFAPAMLGGQGAYISVLVAPLFNINGERVGSIESIRDITGRKKDGEALVKLKKAIDSSGEAIFLTDREGVFTFVNPAFTALYGFTSDEIIGKATPRILKSGVLDKSVYEDFWKTILNGDEVRGELINKKKDGRLIDIESSATPIVDEEKNIIGFLGIQRDITVRKQIEQELIVAKEKAEESDRLKSAFLANMSHEVRTPLNSIIGFSELLADPDFEEEQKDEFIQHIISNGNNLLTIISDIMDISKMEVGEIKIRKMQIDTEKFISDIKHQFAIQVEKKNLELKLIHPVKDEKTIIFADAERLQQIFNNLMSNAIKFTANGSIEIGYQPKGNMVEFYVKDTGIGISSEHHEIIFERFRQIESEKTRKYGGNGLGLSISKNLVKLMSGKIWLESELYKGSVFYFTLPTYNF